MKTTFLLSVITIFIPLFSQAELFKSAECLDQFYKRNSTGKYSITCWKGTDSARIEYAAGIVEKNDPFLNCIEDKSLITWSKIYYGDVVFRSRGETKSPFGLTMSGSNIEAKILTVHEFEDGAAAFDKPLYGIEAKFFGAEKKINLTFKLHQSGTIQQDGSELIQFDGCD
ncbi:MAG: hypothetical protein WA160_08015 [Pseudobdellovibrio sp.]